MKTGIQCLERESGAAAATAHRLAGFFNPQRNPRGARIICTNAAEARVYELFGSEGAKAFAVADRSMPEFPSLYLVKELMARESANGRKTIMFHEMLHWLGYVHDTEFDYAYLAEACCFGSNSEACAMLNSPPAVTDERYHEAFAKLVRSGKNSPIVALTAVWNAAFAAPGRSNGRLIMVSLLESDYRWSA